MTATLDVFGQHALAKYPNRIETYSDWKQGDQTLHAWKPFDSPLSAMHAFTDLCNRYQYQKLIGIYRLVIDNEPAATLETKDKRLTLSQPDTYNTITLNGVTAGPYPVVEEVPAAHVSR